MRNYFNKTPKQLETKGNKRNVELIPFTQSLPLIQLFFFNDLLQIQIQVQIHIQMYVYMYMYNNGRAQSCRPEASSFLSGIPLSGWVMIIIIIT